MAATGARWSAWTGLGFRACHHQPIAWLHRPGCARRFEGRAQGEHKIARALMPVQAGSARWLAHPAFAQAVGHFLAREGQGVQHYLEDLDNRSPFRRAPIRTAASNHKSGLHQPHFRTAEQKTQCPAR